MAKIAQNIAHLRKLRGFTQEQFADELGIKKSRLGSYEENRSTPPVELLIQLADYFNLPIDILVRRNLSRSETESFIEVGPQRVLFPITVDEQGEDMIEVVSAEASAGYLNGYADPEYIEELPKMQLPFMPTGKYRAFPIKGDSMPPVTEGSFIVGKFVEDLAQVKDGNTFVLITKTEGIVYKRVYRDPQDPDKLFLHSDNKVYHPYPIHLAEVLEIWEFTCHINTQGYEEDELNTRSIMSMMRELKIELQELKQNRA